MNETCQDCGTKMEKTNWGRLNCPNCGIQDPIEEDEPGQRNYIA